MSPNFEFFRGRCSYSNKKLNKKISKVKKLLGKHIGYNLKFDTHVETICKKSPRKLSAYSRVAIDIESSKIQVNY